MSGKDEARLRATLEQLRNRFYGKFRGIVTDVDPATLRIQAMVPAVLGDLKSGWCMPCVPYAGPGVGMAFLPEVGAGVWIEFEGGDVSYPIWAGCFWCSGEQPPDATPGAKAIVTKSGHKIVLDDDARTVTISDANGGKIVMDSSGITVESGSGKVQVTTSKVDVNSGALEVV